MAGTVPSSKNLVDGTVPSSKNLVDGTVPSSKNLVGDTVRSSKKLVDGTTGPSTLGKVRTPQYNNFVQSFIHSSRAARIVELYLSLLYLSYAGLSWSMQ